MRKLRDGQSRKLPRMQIRPQKNKKVSVKLQQEERKYIHHRQFGECCCLFYYGEQLIDNPGGRLQLPLHTLRFRRPRPDLLDWGQNHLRRRLEDKSSKWNYRTTTTRVWTLMTNRADTLQCRRWCPRPLHSDKYYSDPGGLRQDSTDFWPQSGDPADDGMERTYLLD